MLGLGLVFWIHVCFGIHVFRRNRERTRPGSLANPSVSLLSHRRSLSTQHHTLVSKINEGGGQITLLFVRTREFRVKKVVNNNRQLYDGLLTYYIKSSFLKLSQFTNCTFLDIEWTRPGSLANPSVSLLSHRRSLSTQHHTLVSKINGRGGGK